jgi:phosphoglycolate phosphatase
VILVWYLLVIFDCDGTLADLFPRFQGVINDVADRFGFCRVDGAKLERHRTGGSRNVLKELGVPWWKVPLIVRHMRQLRARDLHRTRHFPGVPAAAAPEAGRHDTGGGDFRHRGQRAPGAGALERRADRRLCLQRPHLRQARADAAPAPAWRFRPAEAIAIGDEVRDIEAAGALGMRSGRYPGVMQDRSHWRRAHLTSCSRGWTKFRPTCLALRIHENGNRRMQEIVMRSRDAVRPGPIGQRRATRK